MLVGASPRRVAIIGGVRIPFVRGNPPSAQFMADSLAVERRYLAEVLAIPRAQLDAEGGLTYDIFKRQRELDIEGFTYPTELLPVNPFDGMPRHSCENLRS